MNNYLISCITVPMANAAFDLDTPADESRITGIGPTRS